MLLDRMLRCWRRRLPDCGADRPARQSTAAGAAAQGADQTAAARHWGTSPGLSLIYGHLNRLINERDANVIYLAGPGHGGPAIVAQAYQEGTYSEVYPEVSQDMAGPRNLCRRFSTPGGIPSHVSVQTPGSIHEGGELRYVLSHAFGAAVDNPDLIVAAVVGDGEAESGPLAGAWKGTRFLNPYPRRRRTADSAPQWLQHQWPDRAGARQRSMTFGPCCRAMDTRSTS
jgi:phosphoketolase